LSAPSLSPMCFTSYTSAICVNGQRPKALFPCFSRLQLLMDLQIKDPHGRPPRSTSSRPPDCSASPDGSGAIEQICQGRLGTGKAHMSCGIALRARRRRRERVGDSDLRMFDRSACTVAHRNCPRHIKRGRPSCLRYGLGGSAAQCQRLCAWRGIDRDRGEHAITEIQP
jgi:hypothetical protein